MSLPAVDRDPSEDRRWALGTVLPPFSRAVLHPDEDRSHPEVTLDSTRMPIRVAL